jgi:hypothetical protein
VNVHDLSDQIRLANRCDIKKLLHVLLGVILLAVEVVLHGDDALEALVLLLDDVVLLLDHALDALVLLLDDAVLLLDDELEALVFLADDALDALDEALLLVDNFFKRELDNALDVSVEGVVKRWQGHRLNPCARERITKKGKEASLARGASRGRAHVANADVPALIVGDNRPSPARERFSSRACITTLSREHTDARCERRTRKEYHTKTQLEVWLLTAYGSLG